MFSALAVEIASKGSKSWTLQPIKADISSRREHQGWKSQLFFSMDGSFAMSFAEDDTAIRQPIKCGSVPGSSSLISGTKRHETCLFIGQKVNGISL